jgi:hypothetical protein
MKSDEDERGRNDEERSSPRKSGWATSEQIAFASALIILWLLAVVICLL